MPPELMLLVIVLPVILMVWWVSRSSNKMRERMASERDAAIQVGANVVTTSGFYGTIVDIDGDAITLQSPDGHESVWIRTAISGASELPLASSGEETVDDADLADGLQDADESKEVVAESAAEKTDVPSRSDDESTPAL
ncbi:MAG: preprotein translocase subunit YajC [Actinomycetaceae bacterium]|nr:preprotein translocase subunit YajC [Actinomycetaceae bacterium]